MASAPLPVPVRRQRSFAGPIVLIVLGVVFLLGNMRVLTWHGIGVWFAHYWPVLLILWGVIKLIEYLYARQAGYVPSGIGVGGGFLIFFIVILGLGANGVSRIPWNDVFGDVDLESGPWQLFGNKYEYSRQINQDLPANSPVHLTVERGSITVLPSTDDKMHISIHKTIVASSKEEADKIDQATEPKIATQPMLPAIPHVPHIPALPKNLPGVSETERAKIQADVTRARTEAARNTKEMVRNAIRAQAEQARIEAERAREEVLTVDINREHEGYAVVDIEVRVPAKSPVELTAAKGKLEVRGRQADLTLTNAHGDISVEDITGNVNANLRHGDFTARNVKGDVNLDGRISDTTLSDVSGLVSLNGEFFGETNLVRVGKAVRFSSSRTDMETGKLDGELKMDSGDLRVSDLSGGLKVHTRSKDIHLEDIGGDIDVQNSNGDVELHAGKLPLGNVDITNRRGPIQVFLPESGAFQLEARTHGGEIQSDFPEVKVESHENSASGAGSVGHNGKHIQLSTEHADIEIRKSGAVASNAPATHGDSTGQKDSKADSGSDDEE